jgi:hypothetical protein
LFCCFVFFIGPKNACDAGLWGKQKGRGKGGKGGDIFPATKRSLFSARIACRPPWAPAIKHTDRKETKTCKPERNQNQNKQTGKKPKPKQTNRKETKTKTNKPEGKPRHANRKNQSKQPFGFVGLRHATKGTRKYCAMFFY